MIVVLVVASGAGWESQALQVLAEHPGTAADETVTPDACRTRHGRAACHRDEEQQGDERGERSSQGRTGRGAGHEVRLT